MRMGVGLDINGQSGRFDAGSSIFDAARRIGVRLPTSCDRQGQCRECLVEVLEGQEFLNERADCERHLSGRFRLACRAMLTTTGGHVRCRSLLRGSMRIVRGLKSEAQQAIRGEVALDPAVRREGQRILLDGRVIQHGGGPIHGLAIDVGTTTVVLNLVDLESGEVVATTAFENPQRFGGSDVMSRIHHASGDFDRMLQRTLVSYLVHAIEELPCNPKTIYEAAVVGNSTMRDLLFGVDVRPLGHSPFQSGIEQAFRKRKRRTTSLATTADKLGLTIHRRARVFSLPLIGSHVGADAAACLLVIRMAQEDRMVALMDIGTNTELILGNRHRILAASCPAGPAFEGCGLSCGMPALDGAIERIRLDAVTGAAEFTVIGDQPPLGICGSGLVDLVSELMRTGRMSPTGRFSEGVPSPFVVDPATGITLAESDVSRLAQAKAANVAGLTILMKKLDIKPGDIQQLYLAGGFAQHLDLRAARRIGLVPDIDESRITQIGNAAIEGATMALRSVRLRKQIEQLVRRIEHVELEADPGFFDHFVDGCQFQPPAPEPIILTDPSDVRVPDEELARLISWPRGRPFEGGTAMLVAQARQVFADRAQPWTHLRMLEISGVEKAFVRLETGDELRGARLAREAAATQAHAVVVLAVTAGVRIAECVEQLWAEDRPDLAFVLSSLNNAFVEQTIQQSHERLCGWAWRNELAVLAPVSPGNDGWELAAQHDLYRLIQNDPALPGPPPIHLLESGALSPGPSQLVAFLVTRQVELVAPGRPYEPCQKCAFRGCTYRRRESAATASSAV